MRGTPIARPLFFSFPEDLKTYDVNSQFLLGKGVMVSPVLKPGAVSVDAYFPAGKWFDLFNYSRSFQVDTGMYVRLDAPADHINVHLREGNILAMQGEAMTTEAAQKTSFQLVVAVSKSENSTGEAFLDDGEGIEMGANGGNWTLVRLNSQAVGNKVILRTEIVNGEYASRQKWIVEKVTFLGLDNVKKLEGYRLCTTSGTKLCTSVGVRARFDGGGQFDAVEISGMSQLIGEEFSLELNLSRYKLSYE